MDISTQFVLTSTVAALSDFLSRPGARNAFVIGPGGSGKTTALKYLAARFRSENHLAVLVQLREIDSSDQLVMHIARSILKQAMTATEGRNVESDPLAEIQAQFDSQFTASQRLSRSAEVLDRIIELVIRRNGLDARAYIFLDGLDEAYRAGDVVVAIENLTEQLTSTSLVIASRAASLVDRLGSRAAFDTFQLTGLTKSESAEFVQRLFPDKRLEPAVLDRMISRAEGSPLILSLLAAYFRENRDLQALDRTDGLGTADTIWTVLDRVFVRQIGTDQAGMDARLLLSLLVFFQPVSVAELTDMSALSPDRARRAFDKLLASRLINSSDAYVTFAHDLIATYHLLNNILTHAIEIHALRFGDEAAERDGLLKDNFIPPRDLHSIATGTKTIVLGDRGAGKSAIFRALQETNGRTMNSTDSAGPRTITSASQNPASFVQQMIPNDSGTSSADGFKAVWLLYSAALAARDVDVTTNEDDSKKALIKDARIILRQIGWAGWIKGESLPAKWWAVVRSFLPEKVTLKLGPVTVEPNLNKRERGWLGGDIKIDDFIDRLDRLLLATNRRLLIVFDQIDEAFKYQRERQEALVQGIFLAESFLSLRQSIRLIVLLRTDLFELYDIQEKNKFVSRTVRLDWSRDELRKLLLQRLYSNNSLNSVLQPLLRSSLQPTILSQIQFRIMFPTEVEGKPFEEWLFDSLKNGKNHVAPRQIVLFLNLARDKATGDTKRRRIPLFSEKDVADAMTRISELSYEEVISDFRAAVGFVRNCRAGKITEFELEKVKTLFDDKEGSVVLQVEKLERLGFLSRTIAKDGDLLLPRFRIPRLFTRCWEAST
jgi:hypothetical protein